MVDQMRWLRGGFSDRSHDPSIISCLLAHSRVGFVAQHTPKPKRNARQGGDPNEH
jgi:hypothetical protein